MTEIMIAYETAKNFPSGIGGFFGSILGGIFTAWYLRKVLLQYLQRTLANEQEIQKLKDRADEQDQTIILIKSHVGMK
jgi:hypothetical protein